MFKEEKRMTVIEAVRNLGRCIQQDDRYKRYIEAKKANDANDELQRKICQFQLERMNYQRESEKKMPDNEKLKKWESELEAQYEDIISTDGMKEFQSAKQKLDAMMNDVDAIISLCLSGEDPDTCHSGNYGCSGNCAGCSAGCH